MNEKEFSMALRVPPKANGAPGVSDADFRQLGHDAVDIVGDYLAGIRDTPVVRVMPAAVRSKLTGQRLSDDGIPAEELLAEVRDLILPYAMGNGHPRFFGWVNSPPAPIGVIAELLAAGQGPSCDVGDIAALHLETAVLGWFKEIMGYPSAAAGILVSGGTMASLTGLAAARQWVAEADGWDVRSVGARPPDGRRLIIYASAEAHSSIRKSVELLGLGSSSIHSIATDASYRMNPTALVNQIQQDTAAGHRPFCVVASAGTVNSGAIDHLDDLANICRDHSLWLHVDGAYGAVAKMAPQCANAFRGIERAHSLTIDPHKWLSVPVECGCVLVRDGELLQRTFAYVPPYLYTEDGVGVGGPDFAQYGFQQTRGFRALKLWMVLQHVGHRGFAKMINRHIALAQELADLIDATPQLERLAPVQLSIVCFRFVPDGHPREDEWLSVLNRAIEARIQTDGRTFLTSTHLREGLVLRACILHYDTTSADVAHLVEVVCEIGSQITQELSITRQREPVSIENGDRS